MVYALLVVLIVLLVVGAQAVRRMAAATDTRIDDTVKVVEAAKSELPPVSVPVKSAGMQIEADAHIYKVHRVETTVDGSGTRSVMMTIYRVKTLQEQSAYYSRDSDPLPSGWFRTEVPGAFKDHPDSLIGKQLVLDRTLKFID